MTWKYDPTVLETSFLTQRIFTILSSKSLFLFFFQRQFKRRIGHAFVAPSYEKSISYGIRIRKRRRRKKKLFLSLSKKADTSAYEILLPTIFPSIHTGVPLLTVYTTFSLLSFDYIYIYIITFDVQSNLSLSGSRTLTAFWESYFPYISFLLFDIF